MDHKVLVIGGCGYFGSRIVRWLMAEEHLPARQITVLDSKPEAASSGRVPGEVQYFESDITDRPAVAKIIAATKPNIIIHTASPPYYLASMDIFMRNNVEGTRNLLDIAVATPSVHVFIYVSSSSVVHDYVSDLVEADESYPLLFLPEQRQPYHHSKAVAEQLALSYNRKRQDFVVAAIRPSAMFGPGEGNMIPNIVDRAKNGSLRYQIGDGSNCADFTFVDNTVYGLVLAVKALIETLQDRPSISNSNGESKTPPNMRVEGEAFTITNDVHANFWQFTRQIAAAAGYPVDPERVIVIPTFIGLNIASIIEWLVWLLSFGTKTSKVRRMDLKYSTITRTFDIAKAKTRLGYRPCFSLEEGIKLSVAQLQGKEKDA
nr:sterol-4-alpha-carboxylate 3-dehydrogenase, decarboxylating [Quercus suber]